MTGCRRESRPILPRLVETVVTHRVGLPESALNEVEATVIQVMCAKKFTSAAALDTMSLRVRFEGGGTRLPRKAVARQSSRQTKQRGLKRKPCG